MEEHDVFISYAHLDNRPFRPNEIESGWVSRFDYVLSNLLSTELGRPARIWRDKAMDSNDYIWGTIEENMMKSLAFILIISPSYLNSEWCPKEVRTFIERKPVRVGNKSLIFKVVKQPFEPTKVPSDLKSLFEDVLATDFFEPDQNSGKARVFNAEFGDKWEQIFYQKVDFLAQEIAELVEQVQTSDALETSAEEKPAEEASTLKPFLGTTVYMSEPSPDLWKDYLEIRRDFIKRGATVLPSVDSAKPEKMEEYEAAMLEDLKKCKLIVHFVGADDDQFSETNDRSLVELQTDVAARFQAQTSCPRLIWIPQNIEPATERHRKFVEQLALNVSRDVDLLRTSFELKNEMERILLGKPEPLAEAPVQTSGDGSTPKIYVLSDNADAESSGALVDKLFQSGCEVWTVSPSGDGADLIEEHKWYLINCDAALVFWDKAPTFRVRAMMSELQRIMDNGRDRDFKGKGVFISGDSPEKKNFRTHETLVRNENELAAFVAALKNGGQN
jgi:hypothetical protein